jgi:DNA replication and repair protein RecF
MFISSLSLRDFRNYAELDVSFGLGNVVLVGANGQGKTNVVEAINFLATLGSHRTSVDQALIRQGRETAIIRAQLTHGERSVLLELALNREGANKAQFNGSAAKMRDFPRYISTVIFAPEDLLLVRGDPADRRKFMDHVIVQRVPRLQGVLSDYERVLKQRNTLLKNLRIGGKNMSDSVLDIWDEQLVALGTEIASARGRLTVDLGNPLTDAYTAIAGHAHSVSLAIRSSLEASSSEQFSRDFADALIQSRPHDIERGMTQIGPHRDDLELVLNGLPTKGYASHGETWSFVLALKLATARVLRAESVLGDPILILDDVFAELDVARRDRLAEAVADFEQTFITAAVGADVPQGLGTQTFHVEHGTIHGDDAS